MHRFATKARCAVAIPLAWLVACAPAIAEPCPECQSCAEKAAGEEQAAPAAICPSTPVSPRDLAFERSPGGTPEVSPAWLAEHRCDAQVIDIREADELRSAPGHLAGVDWIPAGELPAAAAAWSPDTPIVLVDRSGRRAARAAAYLEASGFRRVAALTGGLLAWRAHGYPLSRGDDFRALAERRPGEGAVAPARAFAGGPLSREAIAAHLGDARGLRWTKAAALLLNGSEACVDGRDVDAVLGTPGGDAGELLLLLATWEAQVGEELSDHRVWLLLDAYLDAFGSFYIHTDGHALEHLQEALLGDPRFAAHRELLGDLDGVERFVRHPPLAVEEALLGHLVDPANVGCGHLRLILQHPEEYRVREGLSESFLRAVFRHLWRGQGLIDYVILGGAHHEAGVVRVVLDGAIRPFTKVPAIAPRRGDVSVFVDHPQVASFCRQQNVAFLLDHDPWLGATMVDADAFLAALEALAADQLAATLRYLAADLPVFEARFRGDAVEVVGPLP